MSLAYTDNNPKRLKQTNLKDTRYASLSWGMFDEEITTKPIERIGNTMFDTKTKKIVAFVEADKLYNDYDFDPVVFAWNVDPLAAKYPHASPYNFVENNPISRIDPDGRKWINGYDATVSMLEATAKENPNDKTIKSSLEYFRAKQADVNSLISQVKTNDLKLFDYIENLKITTTNSEGKRVNNNINAIVTTDNRYQDENRGVGTTDYDKTDPMCIGDYNGSNIQLPRARIPNGKSTYGFIITIYGREGSDYRDETLANEAGDVMYFMEYNADKINQGSDVPNSDSYYKSGGSGEYSTRVETTYTNRKSNTMKGSPPTDNPYPLQKKGK